MIILGLDIGGTGCKCVAFTDEGKELGSDYREYISVPGKPDLDPGMLKDAVFEVIRGCVGKLPDPKQVRAVSVSSFGESIVSVDLNGKPVGDILMYYVATKDDSFERVINDIGYDRVIDITRVKPDPMFSLAKIISTMEKHKNVWKFMLISDYIVWCLCGEIVTDPTLATRTLLFGIKEQEWSDEILNAAGIKKEMLPNVAGSGTNAGKITQNAASELGLSSDVCIFICAQDQVTNALGAGVLNEGDAVDGNGTVECITPLFKGIPEIEFTRKNYVTVPYLFENNYVTYAFNFSGGALLKWYRAAYGAYYNGNPGESFYDYMNRTCPDTPSEVIVLPHFQGAGGTPDMVRDAKGMIYGLDITVNAHTIYRGLLEGLTYEIKYNLEILNRFGICPNRIFATGGGAKSKEFLQIKADIWGSEVIPVLTEEAGAQGCAIMAVAAFNNEDIRTTVKRFVRYGEPFRPNIEFNGIYNKKYETFKTIRKFSLSLHE